MSTYSNTTDTSAVVPFSHIKHKISLSMSKASGVSVIFDLVKNNNIKFIDFRFSDYNGKWLHISHCADQVDEEALLKGVAFDGSSVPAWKEVNDSDMILMPQLDTVFVDPFATLIITVSP